MDLLVISVFCVRTTTTTKMIVRSVPIVTKSNATAANAVKFWASEVRMLTRLVVTFLLHDVQSVRRLVTVSRYRMRIWFHMRVHRVPVVRTCLSQRCIVKHSTLSDIYCTYFDVFGDMSDEIINPFDRRNLTSVRALLAISNNQASVGTPPYVLCNITCWYIWERL